MVLWSVSMPSRGSPRAIRKRLVRPDAARRRIADGVGQLRRADQLDRLSAARHGRPRQSVTSATSTRIMNRIESSHPTRPAASPGLDVRPERLTVVVAATARARRAPAARGSASWSGCARGEALEVLGRQRVQPVEPIGPADTHDAAVGQVDDAVAGEQRLLLAVRVAVVSGDARRRRRRPRQRRSSASYGLRARRRHSPHSAHAPKIVSGRRRRRIPSSPSSASSIGATIVGATSVTLPQSRQIRWTCSGASAAW